MFMMDRHLLTILVVVAHLSQLVESLSAGRGEAVSVRFYRLSQNSPLDSSGRSKRHADPATWRLDRGPRAAPIDLKLGPQTVWMDRSRLVVHNGGPDPEVTAPSTANCILSGRVVPGGVGDEDGWATINTCGQLNGIIQLGGNTYSLQGESTPGQAVLQDVTHDLEEDDNPEEEQEEEEEEEDWEEEGLAAPDGDIEEDDEDDDVEEEEDEGYARRDVENDEDDVGLWRRTLNSAGRWKRGVSDELPAEGPRYEVEVGVYVDRSYINSLRRKKIFTNDQIFQFMVKRWSIVNAVYSNAINLKVSLKSVEIWRINPAFYKKLKGDKRIVRRMFVLCSKTPETPQFDVKVLYSKLRFGGVRGMALLKGVCHKMGKCIIVTNNTPIAGLDLHELGHVLGLKHEGKLRTSCTEGNVGFMGSGKTHRFKDCYRDILQTTLREKECLSKTNVHFTKPIEMKIVP